jgi:hypothetical protein
VYCWWGEEDLGFCPLIQGTPMLGSWARQGGASQDAQLGVYKMSSSKVVWGELERWDWLILGRTETNILSEDKGPSFAQLLSPVFLGLVTVGRGHRYGFCDRSEEPGHSGESGGVS